jgi:surface carbohydrate biosynthesis protein
MTILLPVENAPRELLYKTALSARLANLGYRCFVGRKKEIRDLFGRVGPFIFIDKGYHEGVSESAYAAVKENGGHIVSLDEEGGVDYKDFSTIRKRYPAAVFAACDLVFLWGGAQLGFLRTAIPALPEERVVVSGHPRFELLKPEHQGLYAREVRAITARYGPFILVNTNMGFGNNIRGDEFVRRNYASRIRNIEDKIQFDKRKITWFVELMRYLAETTGLNIVCRPHPEEKIATYSAALAGSRRIFTVYRGSVVPWILGARNMIHPDCTTGVEAAMLGRPSISYLPRFDESLSTLLPLELSRRCSSREQVQEALDDKVDWVAPEMAVRKLHEFFAFDGSALEVITRTLSQRFPPLSMAGTKEGRRRPATGGLAAGLRRFAAETLLRKEDALGKNKLAGLEAKEVRQLHEAVLSEGASTGAACRSRLKMVSKYLYCLDAET